MSKKYEHELKELERASKLLKELIDSHHEMDELSREIHESINKFKDISKKILE
jgi:AraC-like DNA-binding protein